MIQFERAIVLAANLIVVAGCVSDGSRPVALPNGRQGYAIRCHGTHDDISGCMNKAGEICGGPYYIVNQNGQMIGGSDVVTVGGPVSVRGMHGTLLVECVRR